MTSRVSSKNNEKKVLKKKETKQKKKKKKTENNVAGSRTRFICTCKQLLDHCTTVTHIISKY